MVAMMVWRHVRQCRHRMALPRCFVTIAKPDANVKSYKLQGVGEKSKVTMETDTGHSLTTDVPVYMGGSDSAPQPVETLLAAWMGCTQATALFVGRQLPERVSLERIEFVDIQGFRDPRGALQLPIDQSPEVPSRLQRITGKIRVFVRGKKPLTPQQLELLQEQTEIRCPIANMIMASGCAMDVVWEDGYVSPS